MIRRLVAIVLLLSACATTVGERGGLGESQVRSLPPDIQDAYALFAKRCSKCHTLARPLSAQVRDMDHWREYVARMRRQPSSGISPEDAEEILVFLRYYLEHKDEIEGGEPPPIKEEP
jgi:hypothetical protein